MSDKNLIMELFLDTVCKNYPCGSQRCDGVSEEWVEGCRLYQKFKEEHKKIVSELLK